MQRHHRARARRGLALCLLVLATAAVGCASSREPTPTAAADARVSESEIRITVLHFNDIYEITPMEGGRSGGPARVATLRKRLLEANPNTLTVLGGDLFSPSALGTAKVDGERLAGRQMVAVLNSLGLDLATFGNHEFDLDEEQFRRRLAEARFAWVSANVTDAEGTAFPGAPAHRIFTFGDGDEQVRVGFFGVTLPSNPVPYVHYEDPLEAARREVRSLADQVDILIGLTHLDLASDIALAEQNPEIDLILGGHEHENWSLRRGSGLTPIFKGDANVRSVWVLDLIWEAAGDRLTLEPRFVPITRELPDEPETQAVVDHWVELGFAGFRQSGFEPEATVTTTPEALDGREASVRNRPTNLATLIARSLLHEAEGSQAAIFNSGSIRIDDVIPPGEVTQYDVIRILPFGGSVLTTTMTGELLLRVLEQGAASQGTGAYLQTTGISGQPGGPWHLAEREIEPGATYTVAVNDFLVSGREQGFGFLAPGAPGLEIGRENRDVRFALIEELRRTYGAPSPLTASSGMPGQAITAQASRKPRASEGSPSTSTAER